jgi:hypothetical protein
MSAREFQHLKGLSSRRQALHDGGTAEAVCHPRMRRGERSARIRDFCLDRAAFHGECSAAENGEAKCELTSIWAALYRYRADAWGHIADFHEGRAQGVEPDPAAVADLRHCRRCIAELKADLQAAEAVANGEGDAEEASVDVRPEIGIAKVEHAAAFAASATGTVTSSAWDCDDDVPF